MIFSSNQLKYLPQRQSFNSRTGISVEPKSVLLYGVLEQRSEIDPDWLTVFGEENTYEVFSGDNLHSVKIPKHQDGWISLRNQKELASFVSHLNANSIYIDITGLPHHVWMPLVRVCFEAGVETNCIYVEPESYTYNPNPKPGEFFDLSERFHGFSPIPTFARLASKRSEETTLIPLLGFEGIRFRHLVQRIEPSERDISPVIGVPGFEVEYPFHTYEGNAMILSQTWSWQRVNYVDASCPFALFSHLEEVHLKSTDRHLQVATIGTKPHALGAMMYAMHNSNVELLYDHPVKRKGRTKGMAQCHLYKVSDFLKQCK
ncbi:hypothetical protein BWR17_09800 [Phaeobacter inhibens]|uniref:hypothetical protein n=1 Tax=Phaeobacter inhibens TaxID=221822 RepID=UPI0009717DAF|nr:hypothetical protein [Phaeobacter inhibens]APX16100.1 hypothetical protein BWR17_09800 [Phaeobacter inhibens]